MKNTVRRKISPLQRWKAEYGWISQQNRALKKAIRSGANWGQFKTNKQQVMHVMMKQAATEHMHLRDIARDEARRLAEVRA